MRKLAIFFFELLIVAYFSCGAHAADIRVSFKSLNEDSWRVSVIKGEITNAGHGYIEADAQNNISLADGGPYQMVVAYRIAQRFLDPS